MFEYSIELHSNSNSRLTSTQANVITAAEVTALFAAARALASHIANNPWNYRAAHNSSSQWFLNKSRIMVLISRVRHSPHSFCSVHIFAECFPNGVHSLQKHEQYHHKIRAKSCTITRRKCMAAAVRHEQAGRGGRLSYSQGLSQLRQSVGLFEFFSSFLSASSFFFVLVLAATVG